MYYEMPLPPPPENIGRGIWKVMRLQLGIFVAYQLLLALLCSSGNVGFLLLDIFPLILHWFVLLVFMIISFSARKKGAGFGYLISLLVTMIIGFGSCWGISGLVDRSGFL